MPLHLKHDISIPTQTQTVHVLTSSYLQYLKSSRIYAAHSIQTSYFTPNTLCRAHNLMSLHTSKVQNHNVSTYHFDTYPNSPCAHLFILIIFDPISHICAVHTQRKVYHSMPLHTYTVNFAPSSNLQEILLAYRLHSNDPPFAHLFVLIMCEITTPIRSTHHSNIIFYT